VAATTVDRWGDGADGAEVRTRVAPEQSTRCPTVGRCSSMRGRGNSMASCSRHWRGGLGRGRRWHPVNLGDCSRGRLCGARPAASAAHEVQRGGPSVTAPSARSGAAWRAQQRVVTASRAHRETEDGEQGNEEGKSFLASSRAGAEDIGEREGAVHVG
jgi:hypothetical protein